MIEAVWGQVPFRIGLWVGARVTPNRTDDAADWLKQQRGGKRAPSRALGSPHQLVSCPWCGSALEPGRDITVEPGDPADAGDLPGCVLPVRRRSAGHEGLPVVVVDEEIYRLLPSLIIGTVDKFAQLTWRGETENLFGRVNRRCTRHGYVTADTMAEKWELNSDTSVHPAKGGRARRPDREGRAAAAAGPDHPGRAAPDRRAAGLDGRAVRGGGGPAGHLGTRAREAVAAEGHRVHGHRAARATADRRAVRPADRGVPAAGPGHRRQLLRPAAAHRRRMRSTMRRGGGTWGSARTAPG